MAISYGHGKIHIITSWYVFKSLALVSKGLRCQYHEDSGVYHIFCVDDAILYSTDIYIGNVPDSSWYNQEQNDAAKLEFETDWLPTANQRISWAY